MTSASADRLSASVQSLPVRPLRLRRGWVAGCTDQKRITFTHRQQLSECCLNGERAWFLTDTDETFLAAFFDLAVARRIRDAANRCAAFLQVDNLCARISEDHPTRVEVGLFRGEEFEHLIELDRPLAADLLVSLLESLEASMKAAPKSSRGMKARYDAPARDFAPRTATPMPLQDSVAGSAHWPIRCSSITTHRMLQQLQRLVPRTRRIDKAVRLSLSRLELLFSDQCYGHSVEEFLINLLADARHFSDAYELDMAALDRSAYTHYVEELHGAAARQNPSEDPSPPWLHIPAKAWKDISDRKDRSVLTMTVLIGGVGHHLKAIQVQMRRAVQCAVSPAADEELTEFHAACGASGPFETVRIEGRDYVMTLTPHSR